MVACYDNYVYALDAATGNERWRFETGREVNSSPTVADGTVFVGSFDNRVYALDAEVEGSSECSRTRLGTLGHHDELATADEEIDELATADEEIDIKDVSDEQLPGFGVGSALAGIGAAGYLLKRRLDDADH